MNRGIYCDTYHHRTYLPTYTHALQGTRHAFPRQAVLRVALCARTCSGVLARLSNACLGIGPKSRHVCCMMQTALKVINVQKLPNDQPYHDAYLPTSINETCLLISLHFPSLERFQFRAPMHARAHTILPPLM